MIAINSFSSRESSTETEEERQFSNSYTGKVFLLNEHGKWINQYSIPVSDNKVLPQEFVNFYASMTSCGNEVYLSYLVGPEKSNSLNRGGLVRLSDGKRLGDTAGLIVHAKKQNEIRIICVYGLNHKCLEVSWDSICY